MKIAIRVLSLAAFLVSGSIAPRLGLAHWEGVEAADPATPAAVLRLESAAARYTPTDVTRSSWQAVFEERVFAERERQSSDAHSNHEPAHESPAHSQQ